MRAISIIMIFFVLISMVFISGCTTQSQGEIKNTEQVSKAVTNISQNVEDVSSILNDIDKKLG